MKNKHPHAVAVLVLGLAMAGLHLADLLLWSEADTGFAAAGSVWLRYIPWLAAFALPYLPARRAAADGDLVLVFEEKDGAFLNFARAFFALDRQRVHAILALCRADVRKRADAAPRARRSARPVPNRRFLSERYSFPSR